MSAADRLKIWNTYQSAWSAIPHQERQELLGRSVAPDCCYTDAQIQIRGLDALVAKIERSQSASPGASFRNDRLTPHHDQALSEWTMSGPDGAALVRGASFARYGDDGRLTHMTGFFRRSHEPDLPQSPTAASRSWDLYQAAWARVSLEQRRTLLATAVDEAAVYADPAGMQNGRDALTSYINAVQENSPGVWFRQTSFLEHHGQALSRWERLTLDGGVPIKGASYSRFAPDGRVLQMSAFPGSTPRTD